MHARMFASCIKMSNLKGAIKYLATRFYSDLSNLTSLGLLLSRGGLGLDEEGTGSVEGFDGSSVEKQFS